MWSSHVLNLDKDEFLEVEIVPIVGIVEVEKV